MMITKPEFGEWKHQEITKKLYETLREILCDTEQSMTEENTIMDARAPVLLARLAGIREGINLVLNLEVEDIDEEQSSGI